MGLRALAHATFLAAKPQIAAEYQRNRQFLRQLTERLAALPGVTAVGVLSPTPFSQDASLSARRFANVVSSQAGPNVRDNGERVEAINGYVSQTGFDALGVTFLAGRPFSATEVDDAFQASLRRIGEANSPHPPYPAIVNEALTRRIWHDANPVGQYFNTSDHQQAFQVVGVVANFQWTPGVPIDRPAVYTPFDGAGLTADMIVKVRPEVQNSNLFREIDATVIALAPDASHVQIEALEEMVSAAQHDLRVVLTLLGWFATVGIVVASLGIFTAASLLIRSTTRELGIRLALGASPTRIRWALVLRMGEMLIGLPAGWLLGWLLTRQLSHYLVNVTASDLSAYVVSSVVAAIAVVASLTAPLFRAGRIDPVTVLRQE
jgi:ABC-type transport system, involved in lipoprotein release, permease component